MKRYIKSDREPINFRLQQAKDPNTSPEVLAQLSLDRSSKVQLAVAKNPNTSTETLAQMAGTIGYDDYHDDMRIAIGTNPNADTSTVLSCLAGHHPYVWVQIAKKKPSDPEVIRELYKSGKFDVIEQLAKNPNTPTRILRAIAKKMYFSNELAQNPNAPKDLLESIFKEASPEIQAKIMRNPQMAGKQRDTLRDFGHTKSFDQYVGKDIWIEGCSQGIARDFDCYIKLISKRRKSSFKDEYTYSMVYDQYYSPEKLQQEMNDVETGVIGTDSSEYVFIYDGAKTYTTEELIEKLT